MNFAERSDHAQRTSFFATLVARINLTIMNILTLSIKQIYFNQIRSGQKKDEYREIRSNNAGRNIRYIADGQVYQR